VRGQLKRARESGVTWELELAERMTDGSSKTAGPLPFAG
jgi:hypothetical protein